MLATIRVESYNWRKRIFFGILEEDISYEKAEVDYGCGLTARRLAWLGKMVVELMVMVTNIEGEDSYRLLGV